MRLSQTQADIEDHRRRILGRNRLSGHSIGAAWMSERLRPRAEGKNVWSSAANRSVPAYPHIGVTYAQGQRSSRTSSYIPYGPDVAPKKGERNAVPLPRQARQAPKAPTQETLTPGTTYGGRSTLRKRRTGEAQSPAETQINIRWDVRNDGDATANASLRLRQGASRIIATSQPVEVIPTTAKPLYMLWNIPRNIALGGHNYQLDIIQTWVEDGRRITRVAGTHAVTIDVVEGKRFSQWDRQPEDVDLDIGI